MTTLKLFENRVYIYFRVLSSFWLRVILGEKTLDTKADSYIKLSRTRPESVFGHIPSSTRFYPLPQTINSISESPFSGLKPVKANKTLFVNESDYS